MNSIYYLWKKPLPKVKKSLLQKFKFSLLFGLFFLVNKITAQHLIYNGASYDVSRITNVDQVNTFNYSIPFLNPAIVTPGPILNGDGYNNALGAWMRYSSDGTKVFVSWEVGVNTANFPSNQGEMIFEYAMSTPYDLSTAVFNGHVLDVRAVETEMRGFDFNADGTRIYIISGGDPHNGVAADAGNIFSYPLSTPYDLSTKGAETQINFPNSTPTDGDWSKYLLFAGDGTKMYVGGGASAFNRVREYNLSTPYDPATATLVAAIAINSKTAGDGTSPAGSVYNDMAWNEDGSKCFITNEQTPTIYEFATPVPFSFNSAVYLGNSESKLLSTVPNSTIISGDSHNGEGVLAGDGYSMLWEPGGQCVWVLNSSRGQNSGYPKAYRYCLDTGYPEVAANNGAVENTQPITIDLQGCGAQGFADPDNNNLLDVPGQVILGNVPPGLIPILTISATTNPNVSKGRITLTFGGNATAHQNINDIHKITFSFQNSAFATCPANTVAYSGATTPYEYNAFFDFRDNPFPDSDGDGITDNIDLDDDNDGIVDTVEDAQASPDTDGDGIPNRLDLDSDNDGITDLRESGNVAAIAADTNNNGTISNAESPSGANGIPLVAETTEGGTVPAPKDQDGDGKPDPYDLDSDNDGINDLTESGNGPGLLADTNGDGTISPSESPVGTDGIPNGAQGGTDGGTVPTPIDTDGDGVPNFRDLDSDNDGINDITEAGIDPDPDGNGLVPNPLVDADNDGVPDSVDIAPAVFGDPNLADTPNPAVLTPTGTPLTGPDPDGDGIVGTNDGDPTVFGDKPDTDKDGIIDEVDLDDDNDGIVDTVEAAQPSADTDGDGIPNSLDLDSDNDGIPDLFESGNNPAIAADTNGDGQISNAESPVGLNGIPLAAETTEGGTVPAPKDQDGDGRPDPYDLDSDNDGINDLTENGNPTTLAADTNGDGTLSPTESPIGTDGIPAAAQGGTDGGVVPKPVDTDGDLVPDFRDLDSDNDGINDITEAGIDPDPNGDGLVTNPLVDTDNDGIPDSVDANDGVFGDPDLTDTPNPAVKTPNGPIVTGTDPDGDGILGGADGIPNTFGDSPVDTDKDGIPDTVDLDDDNDGIVDTVEAAQASPDTDGDGIPNSLDLDSDNDGIPDLYESGNIPAIAADTNGDGQISDAESPVGANGIPLAAETNEGGIVPAPKDQDGDGKPDPYDLDSDNDGINDLTENGNPATLAADTNSDGTLSPSESPVGTDGLPAAAQGGTDGGIVPKPVDTDGDLVPDFRDLDSDNDGINDIVEAGIDPDSDGNGIVTDPLIDADKDGIPDSVDLQDGTFGDPDPADTPNPAVKTPNGPIVTGTDPDGDGIVGPADSLPNTFGDALPDNDKDGVPDITDLDDDNDGIVDTVEDAQASPDTDGDGIPNRLDLDSDNDGITDLVESANGPAIAADVNNDGTITNAESLSGPNGIPLAAETSEGGIVPAPKDQDGDGKPDPYDLDSDNDGINDLTESGNPATLAADTNSDGTLSPSESPIGADGIPAGAQGGADGGSVPKPVDTDGDLVPDFRDLDSDNDGINDIVEAGIDPDPNGDGLVENPGVDTDKDGIPDSVDAADGTFGDPDAGDAPSPAVKNGPATQTGPDPDGDGILGTADVLPNTFGDGPIDTDKDGIPDATDLDDDNDGIIDTVENAQASPDTDGDGIPNSLDLDSDNDGIPDLIESANGPAMAADTNGDGQLSPTESIPGANGIPLAAETSEGGIVPAPKDQDGDGKPDPYDLDSDNDGINDLTESGNPATLAADTNSDGTLSPTESPIGTDGIPAAAQGGADGGNVPKPVDTDGDLVPDFRDLDSDNDGINDIVEAGIDPDPDGNGIVTDPLIDTDKDGIPDSVDAQDGTFGDPDPADAPNPAVKTPNGPVVTGPDPDGDGILGTADAQPNTFGDGPLDTDKDGIPDVTDLDDDNDGILDTVENAQPAMDTDGDGIPNSLDLDSDNDGISDLIESANGPAITADANNDGQISPSESPAGNNGVPLAAETTEGGTVPAPKDQDGDGKPDPYDLDSDNDGINDLTESGNPATLAADTNSDGTLSPSESPVGLDGIPAAAQGGTDGGTVPAPVDTDSDGVADFRDLDSDNDGIDDITEAGIDPDVDGNGLVDGTTDADNDGIIDSVDANPTVFGDPNAADVPAADVLTANGPLVTGPDPDGDGILGTADEAPNTFGDNNCVAIEIGGIVYLDTDGPTTVNGAPVNGPSLSLNVALLDGTSLLEAVPVSASGAYKFTNKPAGTYRLLLTTTAAGSSTVILPPSYVTVSEGGAVTAGVSQGDATKNSETTVTVDCVSIIYTGSKVAATASYLEIDFGINNAPLPIDLFSFKGNQIKETINLTWKTANAKSFSHFEVLKGTNGTEFGSIGKVINTTANLYNFSDNQPNEGTNYYQLKMVDINGTSKLSNTLAIKFEKNNDFLIAENPANNGEFKIETNVNVSQFNLYNSLGGKVEFSVTKLNLNSYKIKIINQIQGLYYFTILSDKGLITKKIVNP